MFQVRGDSGPAVLLLPGGAASADGFFPGLAEGLIADPGCRVILHDRPGTGTSERPGSLASATSGLHVTIAEAGLGPVVAIGQSLGGAVAALLARDHPGDVAGLVLIDPSPVNDAARAHQLTQTMRKIETLHRLPLLGRVMQPLIGALGANKHLKSATRPDIRAAWQRMKELDLSQLARAAEGLDTLAAGFRESDLPRVPAAVITADRKPDTPMHRAHERLATALGAPLLSWPGADHNAQLTHPDEVLAACRAVVRQVQPGLTD
ncbi:alpha/beta hydrolase [Actinoplanes sp. LDG1-06]|uniref:Alpha/beta hydrolase n=1 Tax=Paractinoplanes ovalisporus TaxID=2810368 RepID=A0ABS2A518_9ACTN|nr:alpha/beta hydrolase [Actinoplanes ovalisporus]MBM2614937.1 alpha/beta hydrolase [Actinoplanes ovalisporus]